MSEDDGKIATVLTFLLAAQFVLAAVPPAEKESSALASWYQGPVRYLLTRREEKEFRALPDDVSRSEFIRQFWRHRDPVATTPENEARISFWRRVVEANSLFMDSALPGWKTDRGKIYILIGPPTDVQEVSNYDVGDPNIAQYGLVRWVYEGVLRGPTFSGTYVVPFVRENDGEYHLSSSGRFASPGFDPLASYDRAQVSIAKIQSSLDYGASDLGTALDQGLLQSLPWHEKDFIDRVTSEAFVGALPMRVTFDFLRSADGSTFAVITGGIPLSAFAPSPGSHETPEITAVARLTPEGGGDPIDIGEGTFSPAPTNATATGDEPVLYQTRVPLRPGRYDLWVGLFERARLQAANVRATIEVPDLRGALALSSIALGRSLRPVPEGTGGYKRPFRISDFEIIPAVGFPFKNGDTFAALWQIYNDGPTGPGSGLQVTTQFYRTASGAEEPIGRPRVVEDAEAVQAYTLELKGWPAASYRFEVVVRDGGGRQTTRSVGFTVR